MNRLFSILFFIFLLTCVSVSQVLAGSPAARLTDMSSHGGVIVGPGMPTVLICGEPAARVTDYHSCPLVTGVVPHIGGPILTGSNTVFIGGLRAARVGDTASCVGPPDSIFSGCSTVLIGD